MPPGPPRLRHIVSGAGEAEVDGGPMALVQEVTELMGNRVASPPWRAVGVDHDLPLALQRIALQAALDAGKPGHFDGDDVEGAGDRLDRHWARDGRQLREKRPGELARIGASALDLYPGEHQAHLPGRCRLRNPCNS
jgi:hypothetical protein